MKSTNLKQNIVYRGVKYFMSKANQKKIKTNPSKFVTFLKISGILVTSALICIATYFVYLSKQAEIAADQSYEAIEREAKREEKVETLEDNISILFVGVDDSEKRSEEADSSRSDALILATLNNKQKSIKLVSIPRDSYVYIPYVKHKDKITHAHAYGGTLASIETIEELFDVPIDYYVRMNFNAFIDVVDALGGVNVEVPYDILELDENDKRTVDLKEGYQLLNGREALALARTRKLDSDIERGKRQQEILKAIITKAATPTSLTKYDDVIEAVGDNMRTDMTFKEMKGLIGYLSQGVPQIESLYLEGTDSWEGGYYYILNEQSVIDTKQTLQSHLGVAVDRNGNIIKVPTNANESESNVADDEENSADSDSSTTSSNHRY